MLFEQQFVRQQALHDSFGIAHAVHAKQELLAFDSKVAMQLTRAYSQRIIVRVAEFLIACRVSDAYSTICLSIFSLGNSCSQRMSRVGLVFVPGYADGIGAHSGMVPFTTDTEVFPIRSCF